MKKKIIVGITGASGVIMGYKLLRELALHDDTETHLVVTKSAEITLSCETKLSLDELCAAADFSYKDSDMAAVIASGTFDACGMIIIPCSMKTAAGIASGFADNLLLRAADVCLKEGRKLVLVPRESPLSYIHIKNLKRLSKAGCIIVPPMLTFYNKADTAEKQVRHIIGKVLMQFGMECEGFTAWSGATTTTT